MEIVFSLANIKEAAAQFWQYFPGTTVFAFHGEMGAGKTTFIHALCEVKGIKEGVGSPTFSLVNEYAYTEGGREKLIYHMDLYRIKDEEEAREAGLEECLYSGDTCLVEWPDRAPGIFPAEAIYIMIETIESGSRRIKLDRK